MLRREVRIEANTYDRYYVNGYVNGKSIRFLVDTGASGVAMSDELSLIHI